MIDFAQFSIFSNAFSGAFELLRSGVLDVWTIVFTSLKVSSLAVSISLCMGIPLGYYLGTRRSVSRASALVFANAGMGLPPTVVGLFVSMMLSRRGPLGDWGLLYSQQAMIIAQVLIATPVVAAIVASGVSSVPAQLRLQVRSLGANRFQEAVLTLKESRMSLFAALAAGFGSIISEVGFVQMVGVILDGQTRFMSSAFVHFTRMVRYPEAVALAMVLLAIIVVVNVFVTMGQTSADRHTKAVK